MANPENKNGTERSGERLRTIGLVGGVIGIIAMLAELRFGATIFVAGSATAIGGEGLRRAGKKDAKK